MGIVVSTDIEMMESSVKSERMQESGKGESEGGWRRLRDGDAGASHAT